MACGQQGWLRQQGLLRKQGRPAAAGEGSARSECCTRGEGLRPAGIATQAGMASPAGSAGEGKAGHPLWHRALPDEAGLGGAGVGGRSFPRGSPDATRRRAFVAWMASGQHGWLRQHGSQGKGIACGIGPCPMRRALEVRESRAPVSPSCPRPRRSRFPRVVVEGTTPSAPRGGCGVQGGALRAKGMRGMDGLWPAGVASSAWNARERHCLWHRALPDEEGLGGA